MVGMIIPNRKWGRTGEPAKLTTNTKFLKPGNKSSRMIYREPLPDSVFKEKNTWESSFKTQKEKLHLYIVLDTGNI